PEKVWWCEQHGEANSEQWCPGGPVAAALDTEPCRFITLPVAGPDDLVVRFNEDGSIMDYTGNANAIKQVVERMAGPDDLLIRRGPDFEAALQRIGRVLAEKLNGAARHKSLTKENATTLAGHWAIHVWNAALAAAEEGGEE
ncbi:MAG TPA: hypothetical protein VF377_10570, partial [Acidimicrobiia bacterium]